jgi:hypothetical protein
MISAREVRIKAKGVRSLVWDGDELVDWADGGRRYLLNGKSVARPYSYPYPLDAAVSSPSGDFAVIYTRLGTKGLVLRRGKIVREIHRHFYYADAYEYPIAMLRLKNGREVLVHCPEEYCRLEIEDLESGERLTKKRSSCERSGYFHSRLAASPDGLTLISAGWVWHPHDSVCAFDVETALKDASHLDGEGFGVDAWANESSATFDLDGRLIVVLNGIWLDGDNTTLNPISAIEIRTFDLRVSSTPKIVHCEGRLGTVMPVGSKYLLGLYKHPRLIELATGEQIQSWPDIPSGLQTSGILKDPIEVPPIALDPARQRCAVADSEGITVLQFSD